MFVISNNKIKKELKTLAIGELIPYEKNPRYNDKAAAEVAESIRQCGYCAPIIVDEKRVILAGHTRYKALQRLGWDKVEVLIISGMTETQKKKYRLLDNKVGEAAEWDIDLLTEELDGLDFDDFDFGFDDLIPDPFAEEAAHDKHKQETLEKATNILQTGKAMFNGEGYYDIPILQPLEDLPPVNSWIGFNYVLSDKRTAEEKAETGVHFFLDDYQFERIWNNPDDYMEKLAQYAVVASPDFSPIQGLPMATQIFNHYRKHWVGAYMQQYGITVIPTITGNLDALPWFLDGEPKNAILLTSAMWTHTEDMERDYMTLWHEIIDKLHPKVVVVYGKSPKECEKDCEIIEIPSFAQARFK